MTKLLDVLLLALTRGFIKCGTQVIFFPTVRDLYLSGGVWTSSLCPDIKLTSESAEPQCMFPQEEPLDTGPSTKTAWSRRSAQQKSHQSHRTHQRSGRPLGPESHWASWVRVIVHLEDVSKEAAHCVKVNGQKSH